MLLSLSTDVIDYSADLAVLNLGRVCEFNRLNLDSRGYLRAIILFGDIINSFVRVLQMKGLLIFGTLIALVAIAAWLLSPKKESSPVYPKSDHVKQLR